MKELISDQQKLDVLVLEYMGRLHDNVAKAFSKLADATSQDLVVSMFCRAFPIKNLRA